VWNAVTVDNCPSTNDTVLLFASGAAGGAPIVPGTAGWSALSEAVGAVGQSLLEQLAADAEGAGHVLIVDVRGAPSDEDARILARAVAESPLVKTAAFGGDPNPGRIVQAVGAAGVLIDPGSVDVAIGGVPLVTGGVIAPGYFAGDGSRDLAKKAMHEREIGIDVAVGGGPGRSRMYGVDLSYEYVRINGEYTT
jgi:glutamate N-acetyltransferase/amino-acid N-acetyltransferase